MVTRKRWQDYGVDYMNWKEILKGEEIPPNEKDLEKDLEKIVMRYFELTEEEYKNIPKKDIQAFLVDWMKKPYKHKELRNKFRAYYKKVND